MFLAAVIMSTTLAGYLAWAWQRDERSAFLPGTTTHGHYQIELACDACHSPFEGVTQEACESCHAEELELADDSHPRSKFTDPRNADRIERVDARACVTCHVEHRPALAGVMGVTQPSDYCFHCHSDIGDERPTHAGLPFDGCQAVGCHNFHDNRALHEDFLEKHVDEPWLRREPRLALLRTSRPVPDRDPLQVADHDAPSGIRVAEATIDDWQRSAHADARVNCSDCHLAGESADDEEDWNPAPDHEVCASCHERPVKGFLAGHHGMRLAQGMEPMRPGDARLPMRPEAGDRALDCGSCHTVHAYDREVAAVDACLGCHDDDHSRAYTASSHAQLFRSELLGEVPEGTGVSCATCHMPREKAPRGVFTVQHNQNDNLRPNEKMIRSVCQNCHGIGFAIDALADSELVGRNFDGLPSVHVESIDMVRRKIAAANVSRAP